MHLQKTKKIMIIMLCALMLVTITAKPIMINAHAIAAGASVIVAVCLASLVGWGITTVCNGLTASDLDAWTVEELGLWASSTGTGLNYDALIPLTDISLNPYGDFILAPGAASMVADWGRYIQSKFGVVSEGTPVEVVTAQPAGMKYLEPNVPVAIFESGVYWGVKAESSGLYAFGVTSYYNDGSINYDLYLGAKSRGTYYYRQLNAYPNGASTGTARNININTYGGGIYYARVGTFGGDFNAKCNIPMYSSLDNALAHVLDEETTGTLYLAPDTNITIPEEENSAKDTNISWGGSTGLTVQEAADRIMQQVVDNSLHVTITQTGEGVEVPEQTWPDITRPIGVEGLSTVFPFCIPFDIVDFLTVFVAEPEAPQFTFNLRIEPLNIDYQMEIDFSMFDSVASILRTLELILFIVGLAFITRSMILRG